MKSYVVFKVLEQLYGIDIDHVKRIIVSPALTAIPEEEEYIEGIFNYEKKVLKTVSFRSLIGEKSYISQLEKMFHTLKKEHKRWIKSLKQSVESKTDFTEAIDPHQCNLGRWIDSFHSDNQDVEKMIKKLDVNHQNLHRLAGNITQTTNQKKALQMVKKEVKEIYELTMKNLSTLNTMSDKVAPAMQKCLILTDNDDNYFGVNVDSIEDILHVEQNELYIAENKQTIGELISIEGILNYNKKLITVLENIKLKKGS